jgi:hypothetical protein
MQQPLEYHECVSLAQYLAILERQGRVIVYSHTAQETFTKSNIQKLKNKRMGVKPGVPDYIVVTKDRVLFIEMKRVKGEKPRETQIRWLEAVRGKLAVSKCCYGFDQAKEFIESNLSS